MSMMNMHTMNTLNMITVSLHRRPYHTRFCLQGIVSATRWQREYGPLNAMNLIAVCVSPNSTPGVLEEACGVMERNPDIPFVLWREPSSIHSPHDASGWMLQRAFQDCAADSVLYVEDDVILSPDALFFCEFARQAGASDPSILGCCCYHETIPEQYAAEGRKPDTRLVHYYNGLNTCGGTLFLREPFLRYILPEWNCKKVEPRGFDYSAHFLMYLHKLYMLNPDYSRSLGIGFTGGSLSFEQWAAHFGKSLYITEYEAARSANAFVLATAEDEKRIVVEPWMEDELRYRKALGK